MTVIDIRQLTNPRQAPPIAELIAAAYAPLAISEWLVPDPAQRRPILASRFEITVAHALAHGTVQAIGSRAVAVWYPAAPVPPIEDYHDRLEAACGPWTPRFAALDDAVRQQYPGTPRREHLVFLAVDPRHQNAGLGTSLLAEHHAHLDRVGLAGYTQAISPGSRRLCTRYAYQLAGAPFGPSGGPVTFWPMLRPPLPITGDLCGLAGPDALAYDEEFDRRIRPVTTRGTRTGASPRPATTTTSRLPHPEQT